MLDKSVFALNSALEWFEQRVIDCLNFHFGKSESVMAVQYIPTSTDSLLDQFIIRHQLSGDECMLLMMALIPHVKPGFYSRMVAQYLPNGGDFYEFGGVRGINHRDILPTGETAQFILAGNDLSKRLYIQSLFSSDFWFSKQHVLWLDSVHDGEPQMSGRLLLDPELVEAFTLGVVSKPKFSMEFPAEHIETLLDWDDLVLQPITMQQIKQIGYWVSYNNTLLHDWGMHKKIKLGYRALFYGPPGTGKTLTASLLGKQTAKDVFRIDLSRMVSKYIGETEKNLARLFDRAENKNWILFFDEADALFGKRTDIRDAHDKYANQEVAYLLQRIENYNGLVILATNQRNNIDDAFIRRFQTIIPFTIPRPEERFKMWVNAFPAQLTISALIDWQYVANRFEITGAGIMNVVHYCTLELLANGENELTLPLLESAIIREFIKEGKIV